MSIIAAPGQCRRSTRGAVLLEVVLALVLFTVAASIIGAGLSRSSESVEQIRLHSQALQLASSLLADVQIGTRAAESVPVTPFEEPFEQWMYEIDVTQQAAPEFALGGPLRIEVVVRHQSRPVVRRLTQLLPPAALTSHRSPATLWPSP